MARQPGTPIGLSILDNILPWGSRVYVRWSIGIETEAGITLWGWVTVLRFLYTALLLGTRAQIPPNPGPASKIVGWWPASQSFRAASTGSYWKYR